MISFGGVTEEIAWGIGTPIGVAIAVWLLTHGHPFWGAALLAGMVFNLAARLNLISRRACDVATFVAQLFIFSWWNWNWSRFIPTSRPDLPSLQQQAQPIHSALLPDSRTPD